MYQHKKPDLSSKLIEAHFALTAGKSSIHNLTFNRWGTYIPGFENNLAKRIELAHKQVDLVISNADPVVRDLLDSTYEASIVVTILNDMFNWGIVANPGLMSRGRVLLEKAIEQAQSEKDEQFDEDLDEQLDELDELLDEQIDELDEILGLDEQFDDDSYNEENERVLNRILSCVDDLIKGRNPDNSLYESTGAYIPRQWKKLYWGRSDYAEDVTWMDVSSVPYFSEYSLTDAELLKAFDELLGLHIQFDSPETVRVNLKRFKECESFLCTICTQDLLLGKTAYNHLYRDHGAYMPDLTELQKASRMFDDIRIRLCQLTPRQIKALHRSIFNTSPDLICHSTFFIYLEKYFGITFSFDNKDEVLRNIKRW